jgi:hypothetical protein
MAHGGPHDLGEKVGEGAKSPSKPNPQTGQQGQETYQFTPEQLAAIRAAGANNQKAPSSYDARNNFGVPMGMVPNGRPDNKLVMHMSPFETAYNSGFLGVTDENIKKLVASAAGGDPLKYDTIYKDAVYQVAMARQGGNTNITVESLLDKWNKSGYPGKGGGGGGPFRTVNRQVALTDSGTARLVVNNALTRFLGREATDIEQRAFLKALNVQEKQNPTTTITEGNTSGRNTTSKSTTTGGFSRDNFAEKFAQSQEGYAEYQAATTYLDAFIDALENPMRAI